MAKSYADFVREARAVIREVDCDAVRREQDAGGEVVFLDVREGEEVRRGTIPGAVHVPRGVLEGHVEDWISDRDAAIVVFCASGNRSALAARTLGEMGFTNVRNLEGGISAWARAGHPVGRPPAF
jgi:rhodanese-related sulfurtransferase